MASVRKLNLRKHQARVRRYLWIAEHQGWKLLDKRGSRPVADRRWLKDQGIKRAFRSMDHSAVLSMVAPDLKIVGDLAIPIDVPEGPGDTDWLKSLPMIVDGKFVDSSGKEHDVRILEQAATKLIGSKLF